LPGEWKELFEVVGRLETFDWNHAPAVVDLFEKYRTQGAKKGDADIGAQLEAAGVQWLISENRHFLFEIHNLPFTVISAAEVLAMLAE